MRYSQLTQRIAGDGAAAWTIHYRALERQARGEDIILLSVGDPDFDTPQPIVQAAIDSLLSGNTHYADVRGKPALREAIARRHQRRSGQVVSADQVTVLAGAQCALFSVAQCVLNPGDEVIVAEPMYVTYEAVFGACGAVVVPVPVRSENGFRVLPEDVAARITPRTRALALNSPHNPSGAMFTAADMQALQDILRGTDILLLSDEVYEHIVFDGARHESALRYPELRERAFVVSSFGKTYHCTGWKLGYCIAPAALSAEFRKVHQYNTFCTFNPAQHAFAEMIGQEPEHHEGLGAFYQAKRDRFREQLLGTRLKPLPVPGGYFQLVDYSAVSDLDDAAFCRWLTGKPLRPRLVSLMGPAPEDLAPYDEVFQCPLKFNAEHYALLFERADLDAPLPSANEALAQLHEVTEQAPVAESDAAAAAGGEPGPRILPRTDVLRFRW